MRIAIVLIALLTFAGCQVTREQLAEYDKRIEQAEKGLAGAVKLLEKAQEKSDAEAIDKAAKAVEMAQLALEDAKANRPEEGEPWYISLAAIAGGLVSTFVGYRRGHMRGLHEPVPEK